MHRGRIRGQGADLASQRSWPWAGDEPPTASAAMAGLDQLRAELTDAHLALRRDAERFIRIGRGGGGIDGPVSVTVQNRGLARGNRTARVDIEVRTGKAFV